MGNNFPKLSHLLEKKGTYCNLFHEATINLISKADTKDYIKKRMLKDSVPEHLSFFRYLRYLFKQQLRGIVKENAK